MPNKIKYGAYVINLDEYADAGTHWIALFCNRSEMFYFNSFGVEHVPGEIKEFIVNKNMSTSKQSNNVWISLHWIRWFYACKYRILLVYFFADDFEKNNSIILSYFKDEWNW